MPDTLPASPKEGQQERWGHTGLAEKQGSRSSLVCVLGQVTEAFTLFPHL